jgi:hypothetical protein
MNSMAALVDQALTTAGVPILGVSIGNEQDRTTWHAQFKPEATDAHKATARQVMDAVPVDDATQREADASARVDDRLMRALIKYLATSFNLPSGQVRKAVIDLMKQG